MTPARDVDDNGKLRSLVNELRDRGIPLGEAIERAARELGKPRALRTAFGAQLSRARAWTAGGLLFAATIYMGGRHLDGGLFTMSGLGVLAWLGLIASLVARRTSARALAFGMVIPTLLVQAAHLYELAAFDRSFYAADSVIPLTITGGIAGGELQELIAVCAMLVAALALLAPWRSRELSGRGVALALLGTAYVGALGSLLFYENLMRVLVADPLGSVAFAATLVAIAGTLRGAAWARTAALVSACSLAVLGISALAGNAFVILRSAKLAQEIGGGALVGSIAAAISAVLSKR